MTPSETTARTLDAATARFIRETAQALVFGYQLDQYDPWLWTLGNGDESCTQEILEHWIRRYVRWVPQRLSSRMFQMLHDEFEQLYYHRERSDEAFM